VLGGYDPAQYETTRLWATASVAPTAVKMRASCQSPPASGGATSAEMPHAGEQKSKTKARRRTVANSQTDPHAG